MMATSERAPGLTSLTARLVERIDGWRVLVLGENGEAAADAFRDLGAAEVAVHTEPSEQLRDGRSFDLVHCALVTHDLQPLSLYALLWQLTAPGSLLLLEAAVFEDVDSSGYARFVPAGESPTGRSRWLPGRLALRWMVECSGFDVQGWLAELPAERGVEPEAALAQLQAVRADRPPAHDLDRHPLGR